MKRRSSLTNKLNIRISQIMLDQLTKYCMEHNCYTADIVRVSINNFLTNKLNQILKETQW